VGVFGGRFAAFVAIPKSHEYEEVSSVVSSTLEPLEIEEMRSSNDFTPVLLEMCRKADCLIAERCSRGRGNLSWRRPRSRFTK
jgi:hypothetical protein